MTIPMGKPNSSKGRTFRLEKIQGINLEYCSYEDAEFILEAKILPNYWVPVHKFYPDIINLVSHFRSQEDTFFVKAELKKLLRRERTLRGRKRPIRIRKIERNLGSEDMEKIQASPRSVVRK